jgi:hypothetical protein
MGHDLRVRDQQREKMHTKLAAKERELGAIENQVGCPLKKCAASGHTRHLAGMSVPLHNYDFKTDTQRNAALMEKMAMLLRLSRCGECLF